MKTLLATPFPAPQEQCSDDTANPADMDCEDYTTHKHSHSLDPAQKITHEGNTDAKFKQLHEVASIKEAAKLRETLELIASPMRPDGTYNRDRRACELLAKEALDNAQ